MASIIQIRNEIEKQALSRIMGVPYYVKPTGSDTQSGRSKAKAMATISAAIAAASAGDAILIAPGAYDETLALSKANMTLIALGGRGSAYVEPSTAGAEGALVTADDVTIKGLGIAGESTSDYALRVRDCARFRAYGVKLEKGSGAGAVVDLRGTTSDNAADVLFDDCEITWGATGMQFVANTDGNGPTQIFLRRCRFHNLSLACMAEGGAAGDLVVDLHVEESLFLNGENDVAPTKYLDFNNAGTSGFFGGNFFATPTNASAVLAIPAKVLWVANATEAGWSTARPAP